MSITEDVAAEYHGRKTDGVPIWFVNADHYDYRVRITIGLTRDPFEGTTPCWKKEYR